MNPNYKSGISRDQHFFISLDDTIPTDSMARVIDAFVDSLSIDNFKYAITNTRGNRPYNPRTLLKIYLLGYLRQIRSSRKLEFALSNNLEFIWISNNLKIKHTTISDFRKDNHSLLKDVMLNFNISLQNFGLISNTISTDGVKVKAVNSKDNNFTLSKLDDRIKRAKQDIDDFEKAFDDENSSDELRENILEKVKKKDDKLKLYGKLLDHMVKYNLSQVSLTDPDSKLMRNNGKFEVSYNNQVSVDVNSHIVTDFMLTTDPADLGSINNISSEVKDIYNLDTITNVTDKGYQHRLDMINCLENGIIPEVTPSKGKDGFTLETDYEQNDITHEVLNSTKSEDIKKCLRSGVIPNVYKDVIKEIKVISKTQAEYDTLNTVTEINDDDLRDFSINNNCFTRNIKDNKVYCPMGEILRQKSTNNNKTRYANKLACKNCKNPCCKSAFKTVDFCENQIFYGSKIKKEKNKTKKITVKKVQIITKSNFELLGKRMATSEHPHASMKFWDNSRYLLLKGLSKATAEVALYYCAYNIRRAVNILGNNTLIEYFRGITNHISKEYSSISNIFLILLSRFSKWYKFNLTTPFFCFIINN